MKKIFTLVFFSLVAGTFLMAQNDTLIWNDWQTMDLDPLTSSEVFFFPDSGAEDLWINWNEDQIEDSNGDISEFYNSLDFSQAAADTITVDSNFIAAAQSWLMNLDPSSSNWLITPAIQIGDDQATLHWKSAALQGPRYMDGYAVKILVDASNPDDATSNTAVYRSAEMISILGEGQTVDLDSFEFSGGYIHADGWSLDEYKELFTPEDSTLYRGRLEPHSLSLAEFEGQKIFVAFHHNSSDDNVIGFDDILVLGSMVSNTADINLETFRVVSYPNPADHLVNLMYRLDEPSDVKVSIYNTNGQLMKSVANDFSVVGERSHKVFIDDMPAGAYTFQLIINGKKMAKPFIKR